MPTNMSEQETLPGISAEPNPEALPVNLANLIADRSVMPRGEYLVSKAVKSTGILIWKKEDAFGPYCRVARNVDPACAAGLVAAHNAIEALIEIAVAGISWAESDGRQSDALLRALSKVTLDPSTPGEISQTKS